MSKRKATAVYNCKSSGDLYRITKFDADANVESSYLTDGIECDCPAGVRPTCRHRQMLPLFKASRALNGEAFFNFDTSTWLGTADIEDAADARGETIPEIALEVITPIEPKRKVNTDSDGITKVIIKTIPTHTSTGLRRI